MNANGHLFDFSPAASVTRHPPIDDLNTVAVSPGDLVGEQTCTIVERNEFHTLGTEMPGQRWIYHTASPGTPADRFCQKSFATPALFRLANPVKNFIRHGIIDLALIA